LLWKWKLKVGDLGFNLSDGMPHHMDLRFADDILLFDTFCTVGFGSGKTVVYLGGRTV